ncbi:hypothetical protein KUCAC02_009347 [Chaenocephalus aceratus]|uniref:Uncharacterized protein n=1 Tax=Chaenocephalus aceratus TaxID=36190 RepID=A0ACB9WTX5_CHAAC|nr:hypothetical protein KUCAC02_009347 [Chaenocephalus aceratus]
MMPGANRPKPARPDPCSPSGKLPHPLTPLPPRSLPSSSQAALPDPTCRDAADGAAWLRRDICRPNNGSSVRPGRELQPLCPDLYTCR